MLLVGGVLFIVIAAGVALVVLMQILSDLERAPGHVGSRDLGQKTGGKF